MPRLSETLGDPFVFEARRARELERAAAAGMSHVLYAKSPGGVLASAARTVRFRPLIEQAVAGSDVSAGTLEAIVLLESAGRPDVIAGDDPAAAAGLTQILAETGASFLGMPIDLPRSRRLTRAIAAAERTGDERRARRLRALRRSADARFDPVQALAGTVRYLETARGRFGRDDLAAVSYHMGIGNLERVLRSYGATSDDSAIAEIVRVYDLSYARVFFDSSPIRHAQSWARLAALGDSSRDYYWRLLAAREIMQLYRDDPAELERLAALHAAKHSAEEVLHPAAATARYSSPTDLERAWARRELQELPHDSRSRVRVHPKMGELATLLGREPTLYRGLRAEALALLLYLARGVAEISGAPALTVTSTVRDQHYQRLLTDVNVEATKRYSLHTTGYAFDILRRYRSPAQRDAFQFMLERLQALDLIAWAREAGAIHITVSDRARLLVPVMLKRSD